MDYKPIKILKTCGCETTPIFEKGNWIGEDQKWCAKHAEKTFNSLYELTLHP